MMRQDVNEDVRTEAAKAIGRSGRAGIFYVSDLLDAVMNESSRWVRHAALYAIVGLGVPAHAQLAAMLECSDIEVRRVALKHLGLRIVDMLEAQSECRKPLIAKTVADKVKVQQEHTAEKMRVKLEARLAARKERSEEARKRGDETPPSPDSQEEELELEAGEDDMAEEANQELDAVIISYVEAIAAQLTDLDEQMRTAAIDALKLMQQIVEPHSGRQVLVWQDGRWRARSLSGCV